MLWLRIRSVKKFPPVSERNSRNFLVNRLGQFSAFHRPESG